MAFSIGGVLTAAAIGGIWAISGGSIGVPAAILNPLIVVLIPTQSWISFRQLRNAKVPPKPPLNLYRTSLLLTWMMGLLVFAVLADRDTDLRHVGFRFGNNQKFLGWCLVLGVGSAGIGAVFHWLKVRRWLPTGPGDSAFFPKTRSEKLAALFLVAPSVGFCEELVYRGYLITQIQDRFKGCPTAASLFVSCLFFGLAHMDQGGSAVLQTFVTGALWAWPLLHSGTIFPSMVIHGLYVAVALTWLGPKPASSAKGPARTSTSPSQTS
jgi:membrane protease YdiL (CAAX protease family)